MVAKVTAREVVHHQIQVVFILECVLHIDEVLITQLRKDSSLIHDRTNRAFVDYSGLGHLLHCELSFRVPDLPNFAETALTDAANQLEVSS